MTLTERMDDLMELRHIDSKAELARLAGLPYSTIDGIYKRGSDNATLKTLTKICRVFDCSLDYLVDGVQVEEIDPHIYDLMEAAKGNDREDIRRAADQLRRMKAYKERLDSLKEK